MTADFTGDAMPPIPAPYDETGPRSEDTVLQVLAGAARRQADGVLVAWAAGGSVIAVAAGIALPRWRLTFLLGVSAAAFGLWGIVDRELREAALGDGSGRRARMLRLARGVIAAVGILAGGLALLVGLGAALGTWIS